MLVDREEFSDLLSKLKPALRAGSAIPALSHLWFDGKSVAAYDGGFGIRYPLSTELECGVPGAPFLGLLSTSVLKEASLEQGDSFLNIKLGKAASKLAVLELEQQMWPFPLKRPKKASSLELGENFIEGLRKVLLVKAATPTRVEHHGVMLEVEDEKLFLYSTDSISLASVSLELPEGCTFTGKTLLPRLFAEQIVAQSPEGVTLLVLEECLIAEGNDVEFYSNVLDISGADDMGAIVAEQQAGHPRPVPLPAGIDGALARAEILSGREEEVVTVAVEKGNLVISGDYALGKLKETLELESAHPAVRLRVKASQLRRALKHAEKFSISGDSLILRSEPDFIYIVASF